MSFNNFCGLPVTSDTIPKDTSSAESKNQVVFLISVVDIARTVIVVFAYYDTIRCDMTWNIPTVRNDHISVEIFSSAKPQNL